MIRRVALLLAVAAAAVLAPHAQAAPVKAPVVTVIDTGIRATHEDFDYRGPASTSDQLVAWWDFTAEKKKQDVWPRQGQLWDPRVPQPYDTVGHGTLTAGLAAGRNTSAKKTPSANPGGKLAVAKVFYYETGVSEAKTTPDLDAVAAAIRWAVDTVHTDVITMSIGSVVPNPASATRSIYDALQYAREHGVLVVVSNGNGFGNLGVVPGDPGWANNWAASPYVLAVGAASSTGYTNSTDPEVAAVYSITGPSSTGDHDYADNGGTSFGTPYVAGYAAAVLAASRQGGHPLNADALEQFVKDSSNDTGYPPQTEGYGVVDQAQLPAAVADARSGRRPSRPSPDLSALYVDGVAGTLRILWTAAT